VIDDRSPLDEVVALELRLLDPRVRATPEEVERLLHENFSEVAASGRRWDRASTIRSLASEPGERPQVGVLVARPIADGALLVTYVASHPREGATKAFHSSLWVRTADGWRVLFHQGTPIRD
jgi:hypothetical protein